MPLHLPRIQRCPDQPARAAYRLRSTSTCLDINAGFEQVRVALSALDELAMFHRGELTRFSALSAETRAAIASYLLSAIEVVETDEAGRLSRLRHKRERKEEASLD